jgi:hypothetical protein
MATEKTPKAPKSPKPAVEKAVKPAPTPKAEKPPKEPKEPGIKRRKNAAPAEVADNSGAPTEPGEENASTLTDVEEAELRNSLRALREGAKETIEHGRLLSKVIDNTLYKKWGYKNFSEYVQGELDYEIRRAKSVVAMARVADTIGQVRPDADEVIASMGLVKVSMVGKALTAENLTEWAERATSSSCREFNKLVKKSRPSAEVGESDTKNKTFKLPTDALAVVDSALDLACEIASGKSEDGDNFTPGRALEFMASQFIATYGNDPKVFLAQAIEAIESRLGVRIVVAKDNRVIYGEIDDLVPASAGPVPEIAE